ncbi:MAG: gas vesicle protein [Hamadaea sp.]|nr:gas vesicle protein [Hamadaea sp.]NUR47461.1 gas vesicle protein [Hamadaea sp.]NUT04873.1 gas vesicle protein [Hamadaea sp.]
MTISTGDGGGSGSGSSLADVVDTVLDKGLVIDAYIGASVAGIELLTINARVVVASVDTYLRFAERADRLQLDSGGAGLPEVVQSATSGHAKGKAANSALGAASSALDQLADSLGSRQRQ